MITIVINSSHRQKQITLAQMALIKEATSLPAQIYLAVPEDQVKAYQEYEQYILPVPLKYTDLPSQRQWCIENVRSPFVMFMDDDLTFFKRTSDFKLAKCSVQDLAGMIRDVLYELTLNNIPLVGISTRLGNNRVTKIYDDNCRVTRCYAINREIFMKVGCKFNPIPKFVMEDFHVTLALLNQGYPNRVLYSYAQNDIGSNAEGGCSVYRNAEVQMTTARWMVAHHPEVSFKVKKSKTGWEGMKTRLDTTVQWKKAFKSTKR